MRMGSFARMCVLVAAKWEVFVNKDRDFLKKRKLFTYKSILGFGHSIMRQINT